jgi:hypothetical protein
LIRANQQGLSTFISGPRYRIGNVADWSVMTRPAGVIVLAFLNAVSAAGVLLVGLLLTVGRSWLAAMNPQPNPLLTRLGLTAGILALASSLVLFLLAYGLFQMREWARVISMLFAILPLAAALLIAFLRSTEVSMAALVYPILLNVFILWYLNRPDVKGHFGSQ